jgi:hypothetical protein
MIKMVNALCVVMGIVDIIAGILIVLGLGYNFLGIIFSIIMIGKGVVSFI